MTRLRSLLVAATATLALIVSPLAAAHTQTAKAQTVTVTMTEFKFVFSTTKIHAGAVTFKLVNKGKLPHNLRIAGKTSVLLGPAKSGKLVVTLKKGKYPYTCTVPGHVDLGMKGTLAVN